MPLGPYASFIVTSYALVTAVVLVLIVWIAIDYRRQKERLRELEASGVTRRSGRNAGCRMRPRNYARKPYRHSGHVRHLQLLSGK